MKLFTLPPPHRLTTLLATTLLAAVVLTGCGGGGDDPFSPVRQTSSLLDAVNKNNISEVQRWVATGASLNATNSADETPLHLAALQGFAEIVQLLINARANLEARKDNGFTPLHNAAYNGHVNVIQTLLNAGANQNAESNRGETPQQLAQNRGHTNAAQSIETYTPSNRGNPGPQICPAGQTGTPPNCRPEESQAQRGPGYITNPAQAQAALNAIHANIRAELGKISSASCTRPCSNNTNFSTPVILGSDFDGNFAHIPGLFVRTPGAHGLSGDFTRDVLAPDSTDNRIEEYLGGWGEWHYFQTELISYVTDPGSIINENHYSVTANANGIPPQLLRQTGHATYKGLTVVKGLRIPPNPDRSTPNIHFLSAVGDVDITANFQSKDMQIKISNLKWAKAIPEMANGLSLVGRIGQDGRFTAAGNSFQESAWTLDGSFYGNKGQEVAGTYSYNNSAWTPVVDQNPNDNIIQAGTNRTGVQIVGSFGAIEE